MKIPTYESQISPTGISSLPGSLPGERRKAITGEFVKDTSISSVTNALTDISNKMMEIERLEQYNDAIGIIDKAATDTYQDADEDNSKEWKDLSIDEHIDKTKKRFAEAVERAREGLKDSKAIAWFEKYAKADEIDLVSKVRHIGWKRTIDRYQSKDITFFDDNTNSFGLTFDSLYLDRMMARVDGSVAAQVYTDTEGRQLKEKITENSVIAAARHVMYKFPGTSEKRIKKEPAFYKANIATQDRLLEEARTADKHARNEREKIDEFELFKLRKTLDNGVEMTFTTGQELIGAKEMIYAVVKDPIKAKRIYAEFKDRSDLAKTNFEDRTTIDHLPPKEGLDFVDSLNPILPPEGAPQIEGDKYIFASKRSNYARNYYAQKAQEISNDTAGWIIKRNPKWFHTVKDVNGIEYVEDLQGIERLKAEARRQGLPETILPRAVAITVASRLSTGTPDEVASELSKLELKFGKENFDIIIKDLTKYGKLPLGFEFVLDAPTNTEKKKTLEAIRTPTKTLNESMGLPPGEGAKVIDAAVREQFVSSGFYATTKGNITSTEDMKSYTALVNTRSKIAAYDVATNGTDPKTAGVASAKAFTDGYKFFDTYRVPIKYNITNVNLKLELDRLTISREDLPEDANYTDKSIAKLKRTCYWTNVGDDGVRLMRDREDKMPVIGRNGKFIEIKFDQAEKGVSTEEYQRIIIERARRAGEGSQFEAGYSIFGNEQDAWTNRITPRRGKVEKEHVKTEEEEFLYHGATTPAPVGNVPIR